MSSQHFIAYHNVDQRGVALSRARSGYFETNKPTLPQKGDVLWCFEGKGRRKEYRLVKRALVARSDKRSSGFQVRYLDADVLDAVVNDMSWFKKLFDAQGRFGFGLNRISDIETIDELESFAAGVRADAVEEDVDAISRDGSLSPTTRKALIDARRGQGRFRSELDDHWGHACAATNCKIRVVLRASHIKPWRLSNNTERLDPANGILLAANVDILFDRGLVSFDDDGRMLTSSRLSATDLRLLGLPADLRKRPGARQRTYLAHHRQAFGFSA
ncbi:HNH endonuclease [Bradyrhizobium vignae]|uniref:HNH endonuclease n=1 Tax=Bradyrhizobium vignae TaxID=1549949 RepID=A0ABS3ZXB3_9BRAD|nr:HNH endonuclease [Bradyrhizobium vignae]MBP0112789.1 HNH endonuclease [Bradyrhizobium vignae]